MGFEQNFVRLKSEFDIFLGYGLVGTEICQPTINFGHSSVGQELNLDRILLGCCQV